MGQTESSDKEKYNIRNRNQNIFSTVQSTHVGTGVAPSAPSENRNQIRLNPEKPTHATTRVKTIPSPEFMKSEGNLADNWLHWKASFEHYLSELCWDRNDERTCDLFLKCIGNYGCSIFNILRIPQPWSLQQFFIKFDNYCNPRINLYSNRYKFFTLKQENNQSFDSYYDKLCQSWVTCQFESLNNSLLLVQIISGINNDNLRKRLLTMPELTLSDAVEECRAAEWVLVDEDSKIKTVQNKQESLQVNDTNVKNRKPRYRRKPSNDRNNRRWNSVNQRERSTSRAQANLHEMSNNNYFTNIDPPPPYDFYENAGNSFSVITQSTSHVYRGGIPRNLSQEALSGVVNDHVRQNHHLSTEELIQSVKHLNCLLCNKSHPGSNCRQLYKKSEVFEDNIINCEFCGMSHKRRDCPAYGIKCAKCGKHNHLAIVCKTGRY